MKKESKVTPPKKTVVAKKKSPTLAVEEKKLTFEGWKRKQIELRKK